MKRIWTNMSLLGSFGSTVYIDAKSTIETIRTDINAVIERAKAFIAQEEAAIETKLKQIADLQSQVDEHKANVTDTKAAVPTSVE